MKRRREAEQSAGGPDGPPIEETARTELVLARLTDAARRWKGIVVTPPDSLQVLTHVLAGRRRAVCDGECEPFDADIDGRFVERLRAESPDDVYFIVDGRIDEHRVAGAGAQLLMDGVSVHLVLPARGTPPVRTEMVEVGGHAFVSLRAVAEDPAGRTLRRAVDVVGTALLLVLLAPVMAVVALLVWSKMGRPLIYGQERVGRSGRPFRLFKFRTMVRDADRILRESPEIERRYLAFNFKIPEDEDPRITPLGRFLRHTSLDELPQLWNVLCGEMSLVGPRPVVPPEVRQYGEYAGMLLRAKPGLTGAWQVGGRSRIGYPERARIDLRYIAGRSLRGDVRILLRTLPAVIRRRGAL